MDLLLAWRTTVAVRKTLAAEFNLSDGGERSFYRGLGAVGIVGSRVTGVRRVGLEVQARVHSGYSDVLQGRRHGTTAALLFGISR